VTSGTVPAAERLYRRRQMPRLAFILNLGVAAAALVSGCATMTRTKSDDQLFVDSKPPGASIFVDGAAAGATPSMVPMPRDHAITIECALPGYRRASAVVRRELAPATAFDIPIFAAIDELTGAAYRLQHRTIVLELEPLSPP
jgi:hypothetical protein